MLICFDAVVNDRDDDHHQHNDHDHDNDNDGNVVSDTDDDNDADDLLLQVIVSSCSDRGVFSRLLLQQWHGPYSPGSWRRTRILYRVPRD